MSTAPLQTSLAVVRADELQPSAEAGLDEGAIVTDGTTAAHPESGPAAPAFERAVIEQAGLIRRQAERLARDPADASDLVQDTLERALRCGHSFKAGTNLRAWLLTILHHLFVDRCRRLSRGARAEGIDLEELAAPSPDAIPRWAEVTQTQLRHAIARLEPPFREPYLLFAVEGLAYQEIAARLRIPAATVGTRLMRARIKLRELLEQQIGKAES